jgi:hypothetical protein
VALRLISTATLANCPNEDKYVGGWFNEDRQCYCLDLTVWVAYLNDALILGGIFRQHAIFDCRNQDSIPLLRKLEAV